MSCARGGRAVPGPHPLAVPGPYLARAAAEPDASAARREAVDVVAVLDPDVVLRADTGGRGPGASREVRGAPEVAGQAVLYSRLGPDAKPALINGALGAVTTRDGRPFSVGGFTVKGGKIVELDFLADPERLAQLDLTVLDD
jgi:hypothetical protein